MANIETMIGDSAVSLWPFLLPTCVHVVLDPILAHGRVLHNERGSGHEHGNPRETDRDRGHVKGRESERKRDRSRSGSMERNSKRHRGRSRERSRSRSASPPRRLPNGAEPLSESDYFQKSDEFRLWLKEEKRKVC